MLITLNRSPFTKSNCELFYPGLQLTSSVFQFTSPISLFHWVYLTPSLPCFRHTGLLTFLQALFFAFALLSAQNYLLPDSFISVKSPSIKACPTTALKSATCSSSKTLRKKYTWHVPGLIWKHCGCRQRSI